MSGEKNPVTADRDGAADHDREQTQAHHVVESSVAADQTRDDYTPVDSRAGVVSALADAMCRDAYALHVPGKGYPHHKPGGRYVPADDAVLNAHVEGQHVVALPPMPRGGNHTRVAVLDFDDHGSDGSAWPKVLDAAREVSALLRRDYQSPYAVLSRGGHGIHVWLLWPEALPASKVRAYLREKLALCGMRDEDGDAAAGCARVLPTVEQNRKNGYSFMVPLPFACNGPAVDLGTGEQLDNAPPINGSAAKPVEDYWPEPMPDRRSPERGSVKFDPETVRAALGYLDANDREVWLRAGLGIKQSAADAGADEEEAFTIWHEWSATAEAGTYKGERDCRDYWGRFKVLPADAERAVTLGSVYHLARQNGWEGVGPGSVLVEDGRLSEIVDRAEAALLEGDEPVYQRGGELVRPVRLPEARTDDDVHRPAGALVLQPVHATWMVEAMSRVLRWRRHGQKGDLRPVDPPRRYAEHLLGRVGSWGFPTLRGVVNAPTLDRDGRVLQKPGFDPDSGLLLDFGPDDFPEVPDQPGGDEAAAALARLAYPLRGFPFVDGAARSVALSALLTALIRPNLRTAPLHGFDAPTAGTGKSMLAETAGLLATGSRPPAASQGKTDEEDEKRLSTILHAGDPVILLDNCDRPLRGDFLCSMLTQEVVQARILGQSERRVLPSTALLMATGNNLTFAGDVSRRAVVCRLDAKSERPDQREFDFDCQAEVRAARAQLLVDGLTVLRAHALADPTEKPGLKPMGSFADWSWVRGALVWLGYEDPADTREEILENDPEKESLVDVMDAWEVAFGDRPVEVSEIKAAGGEDWDADDHSARDLYRLLTDVACRGGWNPRSVGWWLKRNKDRVVGGRYFQRTGSSPHVQWRLRGAARPMDEDPGREQDGMPF